MLRVGLTGGLGSGKSTAAALFASLGAHVLQSDAIGRELMQPGQAVHATIAAHFGPGIVLPDGTLDRAALSRIAFTEGRVEELNAIVHPAVIDRQYELTQDIARREPHAVILVESALIFETRFGETRFGETRFGETRFGEASSASTLPGTSKTPWHTRFDRLILVTAPEELKIARYVERIAAHQPLAPERREELKSEARRRLAQQTPDEQKSSLCDYILTNSGRLTELEWQVDRLWPILQSAAAIP